VTHGEADYDVIVVGAGMQWYWTERFAAQPEILAYLDFVADRFGVKQRFVFGTWVTSASDRHRGRRAGNPRWHAHDRQRLRCESRPGGVR